MTKINDDSSKRTAATTLPAPPDHKPVARDSATVSAKGGEAPDGDDSGKDAAKKAREAAKATGNVPPPRTGLDEGDGAQARTHHGHKAKDAQDDTTQDTTVQEQDAAAKRRAQDASEQQEGQQQVVRSSS